MADSHISSPDIFSSIWSKTIGNDNSQVSWDDVEAQPQNSAEHVSQEISHRTQIEWSKRYHSLHSGGRISYMSTMMSIIVESRDEV